MNAASDGPCADDALALSNAHCTPGMPPTPLLYKNASVGTASHATTHEQAAVHSAKDSRMQPAPLPYDSLARFPPQLHRNTSAVLHNPALDSARRMVNVSLTPEPMGRAELVAASDKSASPSSSSSVQEMVQVVLQGEAGVHDGNQELLRSRGTHAATCSTGQSSSQRGTAAFQPRRSVVRVGRVWGGTAGRVEAADSLLCCGCDSCCGCLSASDGHRRRCETFVVVVFVVVVVERVWAHHFLLPCGPPRPRGRRCGDAASARVGKRRVLRLSRGAPTLRDVHDRRQRSGNP